MKIKIIVGFCCLLATAAYGAQGVIDYCKVDFKELGEVKGIYRGECRNNTPHGMGEVAYYAGDRLEGRFVDGQLHGEGVLHMANGDVYEGLFVHGKRQGEGAYTWAQGSQYIGQWSGDQRHGQGVFTWLNGSRFEGEFRENKRYNGKFYSANGRVLKCYMGSCR